MHSFLVTITILISASGAQAQLRKEAYATVPQLITSSGYPLERHRAYTEDGYILQMHRIPAGRRTARRAEDSSKGKRAVLLVHGLLGSSGDFVIMGPKRSLGYMLADAGYDVWIANLRGTTYSAHQNLTKNDPKFWNFSIDEHGKYDVPAIIDKVLNVTRLRRLFYIGYSMGTTSFYSAICQHPEYNSKIIAFAGLAPAIYLDNVRAIAEIGLNAINLANVMKARGVYSIAFPLQMLASVIGGVCNARNPQYDMCLRVIYSIVGEDYEQNDWDMSPVFLARIQPASWGQIEQFGKIALTGVFTRLGDGLLSPPIAYDLTAVKVPSLLLYGPNDRLTEKSQILRLAKTLNSTGTLYGMRGIAWSKFNHLDFVFAKDVGKLVNRPLIKHLNILYNKYGSL